MIEKKDVFQGVLDFNPRDEVSNIVEENLNKTNDPDSIEKTSLRDKAPKRTQYNRWADSLAPEKSFIEELDEDMALYNQIIKDNLPEDCKYSWKANKLDIHEAKKKVVEQMVQERRLPGRIKEALEDLPQTHDFDYAYAISILNRYFDVLGSKRIKTYIDYLPAHVDLVKIAAFFAGEMDKIISKVILPDLKQTDPAKLKSRALPKEVSDVFSRLMFLEKVMRVKEMTSDQVDDHGGYQQVNKIESKYKEIVGRGFVIRQRTPKRNSNLKRKAFICYDTHDCDEKKLRSEIGKLERSGYTPYICTFKWHENTIAPENAKNRELNVNIQHLNGSNEEVYEDLEKICERIFNSQKRLKDELKNSEDEQNNF